MPTIGEALLAGSRRLKEAGVDAGGLEASLLLAAATGMDRLRLVTHSETILDEAQTTAYQTLIARREAREPYQYIAGSQEFMGLNFQVDSQVLIPRPDTEILVEAILDVCEAIGCNKGLVADLGTGSGAIAIALARFLPGLQLLATDISEQALNVARANARSLEVPSITFLAGSGLAPLMAYQGQLDWLVSNPPYIAESQRAGLQPEVRDFEPPLALFAPEEGLYWYRILASDAPPLLAPGGHLAVEVGQGQAGAVRELLVAHSWEILETRADLAGIERAIVARRAW